MGLNRAFYRLITRSGADKLLWRLDSRRLRILCYHGICADELKGAPWIPDFFVTRSEFERQMRHLQTNARVLPLAEAAARLRAGTLPPRSVSITFDDGYANNLHLAYPVLESLQLPATIFLSSGYVESGDFYPFLKLKLIELKTRSLAAPPALPSYKSAPLDLVLERIAPWWEQTKAELTGIQRETLRPLTAAEIRAFPPDLVEFGGHGHTHCILGNEQPQRRRREIVDCISQIAAWTKRAVRLFSYPNGQPRDFSPADQKILQAEGITTAVSGIAGANGTHADPLALQRYPVGMYHDQDGFRAEISGLRTAILRMS